jgi:hypothetical protein
MTRLFPIVAGATLALAFSATCFAAGRPAAAARRPTVSRPRPQFAPRGPVNRFAGPRSQFSRRGPMNRFAFDRFRHRHHHHDGYQGGVPSDGGMATGFAWPTSDTLAMTGSGQDSQSQQIAQTLAKQNLIQNLAETTRALNESRQVSVPAVSQPESAPVARRPVAARTAPASASRPAATRLSAEQFDRQTGVIQWPEALQDEGMAAEREAIEELAAAQATNPEAARPDYREVRRLTEQMKEQLKGRVRDLPTGEYVGAKKFLDALACELCPKPARQGLAAN